MQTLHNNLDQKTWDAFVLAHGPKSGRFLQSYAWGEFQKSAGEIVDRVSWMENDRTMAVAQVIHRTVKGFGTYAYIPRGPIEISSSADLIADVVDTTNNDMFIRVEALRLQVTDPKTNHRNFIATRGTHPSQPAHTLITDLDQSEEQLFSQMHEKTRYNIRLAEKKGVTIEIRKATIDEIWPVFEMTSSRDAFRLHTKEYYKKMLEKTDAFLAVAKHEGEILAANIMIDFGNTRTYLHGASSNNKRNLMAPFLLHWELMKQAKSINITSYDWWGIAPADASSSHAWAGISRFKRGFGGEEVSYPHAYDVVLKPLRYAIYRLARALHRRGR